MPDQTYRILSATTLVDDMPGRTVQIWVRTPDIVGRWQPGQFVIVRTGPQSERIPLTIVAGRPQDDALCLVVQQVGKSTRDIVELKEGDAFVDVCGPLGTPSEIRHFGTCLLAAGGYGSAAVLPIARELSKAGNRVLGVIGARTDRLIVLDDELAACTDVFEIATEDGTRGQKGMVLGPIKGLLDTENVDRVIAIGPMPMMKAVAEMTRPLGIPTVASLNPIMLDGTGMCGACRVHVKGEMRFACVDGPEFDAHDVDFDELAARLGTFREQERSAMEAADASA